MTHIESRAGTAAAWTSANPVLAIREMGWETDTSKAKIGDGSTAWNSLPYFFNGAPSKSSLGLGNVDNTADVDKPVSAPQAAALALKAPLASPTFTGDPKAPTPATTDNDTSIATTAFVNAAMAATTQFARNAIVSGDLNTFFTSGLYKFTGGSNFPVGVTSGYLTVAGDTSNCGQTLLSADGSRAFYRTWASSTWTPWREMAGHLTVAGSTLTNDTLSGLAARDGYTPVAGDLILVPFQTTGSQNGIYVAASGAWTRWSLANTSTKVAALGTVKVTNGSVQGGTRWVTYFKSSDTLDTTSMRWSVLDGDTGFINLTIASPWSQVAGLTIAQYRRVGNLVHMRGRVGTTTGTTNSTIGTLPIGFRPSTTEAFVVYSGTTGNGIGLFQVLSTGDIAWAAAGANGNSTQVDLNGTFFIN